MNRAQRRAAERKNHENAARQNGLITPPPPTTSEPPRPVSEARLAANRANAQLSTGPTSDAGKAKASLNALKTGLTGRTVLLPMDDGELYEALVLDYEKELQPVGAQETAIVQSIVDIRWRLDRIPGLESALLAVGRAEFHHNHPEQSATIDPLLLEMQIRIAKERHFRNLHIQEQRLVRRRAHEMAWLQRLQEARKVRETVALKRAAQAALLAKHWNQPITVAELGFEISNEEIDAHLATLTASEKQKLLDEVLENVGHEPGILQKAA